MTERLSSSMSLPLSIAVFSTPMSRSSMSGKCSCGSLNSSSGKDPKHVSTVSGPKLETCESASPKTLLKLRTESAASQFSGAGARSGTIGSPPPKETLIVSDILTDKHIIVRLKYYRYNIFNFYSALIP